MFKLFKRDLTSLIGMGARLLIVRYEQGLTQRDFARSIGASLREYASVELGKRSLRAENLMILVKKYDVDEAWLLSGKNKEPLPRETSAEFSEFCLGLTDYLDKNSLVLLPQQRLAIESKWLRNKVSNVVTTDNDVITWAEVLAEAH